MADDVAPSSPFSKNQISSGSNNAGPTYSFNDWISTNPYSSHTTGHSTRHCRPQHLLARAPRRSGHLIHIPEGISLGTNQRRETQAVTEESFKIALTYTLQILQTCDRSLQSGLMRHALQAQQPADAWQTRISYGLKSAFISGHDDTIPTS